MCTSDTESRKDLLVELFDELKASYLSCPLRVYCLWLAAIHPRNMPTGSKSAAGYRSFCFPQSRNNRDPGEWRYKSTLLQYVDGWGLDLCAQAAHRSKKAFFCKNFCFHAAFWCFARHFLLRLSLLWTNPALTPGQKGLCLASILTVDFPQLLLSRRPIGVS